MKKRSYLESELKFLLEDEKYLKTKLVETLEKLADIQLDIQLKRDQIKNLVEDDILQTEGFI